jgi:threonine/homoserine/homoserine lactone efflux protein
VNSGLQLLQIIPAFALTALLLAVVPGQGVAMVLRQSLVGGKRAAFYSVFGNSSGLIIWGAMSAVGLSAVFAKSHTAFNILKYLGVAFLVGLAIQTLVQLRNEFGKFDVDSGAKTDAFAAFRLGLFTNLTNVKAAVFAVAFIPQFVPHKFSLGLGIFILSCVQATVSLSWYTTLILAVDKAAIFLARPKVRRALTGISAVGIILLAIGLLLSHPRS